MSSTSPERRRGDKWAEALRASGCWVQKLTTSAFAGLPDWRVGRLQTDKRGAMAPRFVEAKTLEAVLSARRKSPRNACTDSQRFFLDREQQSGGTASLLIVGQEGWVEIEWVNADRTMTEQEFDSMKWNYPNGWTDGGE